MNDGLAGGKDLEKVSTMAQRLVEAARELQLKNAQLALQLAQAEQRNAYSEELLNVLARSIDEALSVIGKNPLDEMGTRITSARLERDGDSPRRQSDPGEQVSHPNGNLVVPKAGEGPTVPDGGKQPKLGLMEQIASAQTELNWLRQQVEGLLSRGVADQRMRDMVIRDELTSLYNYRYFQDRLRFEIEEAQTREYPLSVLMIDVDSFKVYNDTFGHVKGNDVLRTIAKLIREHTRYADTAARYGGDEFAVILAATPGEGALFVGERLRKEIERYPFEGREHLPGGAVTVTVGVAECLAQGGNDRELVQRADEGCLHGKRTGKNRVIFQNAVAGINT